MGWTRTRRPFSVFETDTPFKNRRATGVRSGVPRLRGVRWRAGPNRHVPHFSSWDDPKICHSRFFGADTPFIKRRAIKRVTPRGALITVFENEHVEVNHHYSLIFETYRPFYEMACNRRARPKRRATQFSSWYGHAAVNQHVPLIFETYTPYTKKGVRAVGYSFQQHLSTVRSQISENIHKLVFIIIFIFINTYFFFLKRNSYF